MNKDEKIKVAKRRSKDFAKRIDPTKLHGQKLKLYRAFALLDPGDVYFSVKNKNGETVEFKIPTKQTKAGVIHILCKHYGNRNGEINAYDIINMLDVIKKGNKKIVGKHNEYRLRIKDGAQDYLCALKISRGNNVLLTYYIDKKSVSGSRFIAFRRFHATKLH